MTTFFDDTLQGLLEAVAIQQGEISLIKKDDMPAPTYVAADKERELIDELICLRKEQHISQTQLAALTGNKQQAISRIEKKEHSPSLKLFYSMAYALGYDVRLVKM